MNQTKKNISYNDTAIVIGIPFDDHSSFLKGASKGPEAIRTALYSESTNLATESGVDLGSNNKWQDIGNIDITNTATAFVLIENVYNEYLKQGARIITLGGDHSITLPIVRSYSRSLKTMDILQLDAHPDLYDELDGNRESHGCPFARIMEENLV